MMGRMSNSESPATKCLLRHGPDWALCGVAMLAGLLARVWRLGDQSVWYDEWITVRALDVQGLAERLRVQGELDWSFVPAYHILQYYWSAWVSDSDVGIRWLSVLLSLLTFPPLYAFALRLYGRWAAFIAVMVFALAPYQIFQGQSIRNYPLAILATVAAFYALQRAAEPGGARRWWVANAIANAVLIWTHAFGAFIFAVQGLYLLFFRTRPVRVWFAWGCVHAGLVLSIAAWQWTLPGNADYPDVPPPPMAEVYKLVQKHYTHPFDWVDYNLHAENAYDMLSPWGAWFTARHAEQEFRSVRMRWGDRLYLWTGLLLLVYSGTSLWRMLRERGEAELPERERFYLTAAWTALPLLCLMLIAWGLHRQVLVERYMTFAYLGMYVAIGAGVARMRWNALRIPAAAVLIGLLGIQAAAMQVIPLRHDYAGAAKLFKAHASEDETVIAYRYNAEILFRYNLHEPEREIARADDYEQLLGMIEEQLSAHGKAWVVMEALPEMSGVPGEDSGLAERAMTDFSQRGWPYTRDAFGGMYNVWLFRIGEGDGGGLQKRGLRTGY